jgi:hypothetical protein
LMTAHRFYNADWAFTLGQVQGSSVAVARRKRE